MGDPLGQELIAEADIKGVVRSFCQIRLGQLNELGQEMEDLCLKKVRIFHDGHEVFEKEATD